MLSKQKLEQVRHEFKETLEDYTDYNLVDLISFHRRDNPKTGHLVVLYGTQYGDIIYEECLEELFKRESPLLKEVLV